MIERAKQFVKSMVQTDGKSHIQEPIPSIPDTYGDIGLTTLPDDVREVVETIRDLTVQHDVAMVQPDLPNSPQLPTVGDIGMYVGAGFARIVNSIGIVNTLTSKVDMGFVINRVQNEKPGNKDAGPVRYRFDRTRPRNPGYDAHPGTAENRPAQTRSSLRKAPRTIDDSEIQITSLSDCNAPNLGSLRISKRLFENPNSQASTIVPEDVAAYVVESARQLSPEFRSLPSVEGITVEYFQLALRVVTDVLYDDPRMPTLTQLLETQGLL